ncbi:hypothetical protein ACFE04_031432 [Oxalis oulophora]
MSLFCERVYSSNSSRSSILFPHSYSATSSPTLTLPFFFKPLPHARTRTPRLLTTTTSSLSSSNQPARGQQPPRTLYPGGFKRPEIKVPNLVLVLNPDDVFGGKVAMDTIDQAVAAKWIGIVVLNAGDKDNQSSGGGRIYESACLLKSVIKDRAYLLIVERVDIAAAVAASGVVLSDQGLPAIVARNTMLDSKTDSVVLPLVGRIVQTPDAAKNASKSEGADFLIYNVGNEKDGDSMLNIVMKDVKIPIFVSFTSREEAISVTEASKYLKSGAGGLAVSFQDLKLLSDDVLGELFYIVRSMIKEPQPELMSMEKIKLMDVGKDGQGKKAAGFVKLAEREKQLIVKEKLVLLDAINVIQKAAPLMKEVSLLIDAVSQIDEPFMLAIVGEFNSGKSTVINALLGQKYLKEGVVPTTNEITFLRYSTLDSNEQQRCERNPDGQYVCYLPAPILKEMNIVDTPGTNVILQRQQRLTEEFVPRADLLLFVISADRPLTESEVNFLRYTQQWKKRVVFVLNKSDLFQNDHELEEAISFIKKNTEQLLNTNQVTLYPVSARSALQSKLSASVGAGKDYWKSSVSDSPPRVGGFYELEKFLYSFLDGSTETGMERMKLKLETPVGIAERLVSSCETLVRQDYRYAKQDLASANKIVDSVKECVMKMENESLLWRRPALSLVDTTKSRVIELVESTLQVSNLDLVASYVFQGGKSGQMPATSRVQSDIIGPAISDAERLLGDYVMWLQAKIGREGKLFQESFDNKWPEVNRPSTRVQIETYELLNSVDKLTLKVIGNLNASAASKQFEQEVREVFLGTFGGLGAAGLSASLLTSVLPTTLEDLLALALCSTAGYITISNFPSRRQKMIEKINKMADALARELEDAMQKDLLEAISKLENFVKTTGKPYQEAAQNRVDRLEAIQEELSNTQKELQNLQVEIQNLHLSLKI